MVHGKTTGSTVCDTYWYILISVNYICTNQGCGLFEKSHSFLQFLSALLCIPVGLELDLSEAILVGAHIQVPKCFRMRNDLLDLS